MRVGLVAIMLILSLCVHDGFSFVGPTGLPRALKVTSRFLSSYNSEEVSSSPFSFSKGPKKVKKDDGERESQDSFRGERRYVPTQLVG